MAMKACPVCKAVFDDVKVCDKCNVDLSDKFSGLVVILDPEKSEVSKLIEKNLEGKFAIKVK